MADYQDEDVQEQEGELGGSATEEEEKTGMQEDTQESEGIE